MKHLVNGVQVDMTPEQISAWQEEQAGSAPTIEQIRGAKLAELDDKRWQVEIGGTMLGDASVRTDANSQAKVTAAYTMARLDPDYEIPTWEVAPGVFMPLNNATIIAMGLAVRDHVQSTFNRKAELHAEIMALPDIDALIAYNVDEAW